MTNGTGRAIVLSQLVILVTLSMTRTQPNITIERENTFFVQALDLTDLKKRIVVHNNAGWTVRTSPTIAGRFYIVAMTKPRITESVSQEYREMTVRLHEYRELCNALDKETIDSWEKPEETPTTSNSGLQYIKMVTI